MTDTELKRRKAICEVANVADIGDLSDGFHTFNGLYYQRMILFASLVRAYKDRAWKSYRHEDGELCFGGGWFIVGIDTPEGSYTYHYESVYFDWFDCVELPNGKHWDGHTEDDVTRLLSLPTISTDEVRGVGEWIPFETRPMDDEEREYWSTQLGYDIPEEEAVIFCSTLPDDGQEVLVCSKLGHVWIDEFQNDPDYGVGLETNGDMDGILAWMPLPKPMEVTDDA